MKKNEYVVPEMEIVEITEKYTILDSSPDPDDRTGNGEGGGGGFSGEEAPEY